MTETDRLLEPEPRGCCRRLLLLLLFELFHLGCCVLFNLLLGAGAFYLGLLMYTALGYLGLRFDAYLLAPSPDATTTPPTWSSCTNGMIRNGSRASASKRRVWAARCCFMTRTIAASRMRKPCRRWI